MKRTTYDRYMSKVFIARGMGANENMIIAELLREREVITSRCLSKQAALVNERTPYKAREAKRMADECIAAIDRIVKELEVLNSIKEIKV